MRKYCLLLTLSIKLLSFGQPSGYDKNIIWHGIYLTQTNGLLNYAIDKPKPIQYNYLNTKPLYASAHSQNVNILLEYINPLKLNYEVSFSSQVNPNLENVVNFFNVLAPMLNGLGFSKLDKTEFKIDEFYTASSGTLTNGKLSGSNLSITFSTQELYQLALLVIEHPELYSKEKKESKKMKVEIAKNLSLLRNNQIDFSTLVSKLKTAIEVLTKADDVDKAKKARETFDISIADVMKELNNQKALHSNIMKFFEGNDELKTISEQKPTSYDSLKAGFVKDYRIFLLKQYNEKVNDVLKKTENVIEKVVELATKFDRGMDFYYDKDKSIKIAEIPIEPNDIKEVDIQINTYEITVSDDLEVKITQKYNLKAKIFLKDYSILDVDFATGLLFPFGFSYNKYSTRNDPSSNDLVVTKIKPEEIRYLAGTMLNLIFKTRTYPAFPMIQLGIGTGKDSPTLFAGVGFKFIKNFSISGGIVSGWYKELNNLKVDDRIQGNDQLQNDYKYVPIKNPAFYLGVQYSF